MKALKVYGENVKAELIRDFSEDYEFGELYITQDGRYITKTVNGYEYIDVENEEQALQGAEEYYRELEFHVDKNIDPKIFINNFLLEDIVGKKWGEIEKTIQERLIKNATCIDARTSSEVNEGDCTVDFDATTMSVPGKVVNGEIKISDDAVVYNNSTL